jgi:hypothetical protein
MQPIREMLGMKKARLEPHFFSFGLGCLESAQPCVLHLQFLQHGDKVRQAEEPGVTH